MIIAFYLTIKASIFETQIINFILSKAKKVNKTLTLDELDKLKKTTFQFKEQH